MQVAGNKEIESSIAIVVAPRDARRPVAKRYARFLGNVGERSIVVVVVEAILPEVGNIEIGPAIVVIVGHSTTEPPATVADAGFLAHIRESAVMIVVKESGMRRRFFAAERVNGRSVDEIDVETSRRMS